MLDQNITVLLSTLLGGVLTTIGGFIAVYYTQRTTKSIEERKHHREKVEELYIYLCRNSQLTKRDYI